MPFDDGASEFLFSSVCLFVYLSVPLPVPEEAAVAAATPSTKGSATAATAPHRAGVVCWQHFTNTRAQRQNI